MHLFSLEFFIEQIDLIQSNIDPSEVLVKVKCQDIFEFTIKYDLQAPIMTTLNNQMGSGKAVFFPCLLSNLISVLKEPQILVEVSGDTPVKTLGIANIKWNNFEQESSKLTSAKVFIKHEDEHGLMLDKKQVGTIKIVLFLISYGEKLESSISSLRSMISIPIKGRESYHGKRSAEDNWDAFFVEKHKPQKSYMDQTMLLFAEMAGITAPEPIESLLTPEYINRHLCNQKTCPAAMMFKQYGLGPLAESNNLGTITSLKNVKPQGLYGMSQAYGTMDDYGAYGFFVKKKDKKKKTDCGSPDCPYTSEDVTEKDKSPKRNEDKEKCYCKRCNNILKFTSEERTSVSYASSQTSQIMI